MFDKKTVIAFILIAVIFIVWQYIFMQNTPPPEPAEKEVVDTVVVEEEPVPQEAAQQTVSEDTVAVLADTLPEQLLDVETDFLTATLSNKGGGLITLQFKQYHYADNGGVYLLPPENNQATPSIISKTNDFTDTGFAYTCDIDENIDLSGAGDSAKIVYTTTVPDGSTIRKEYTFFNGRYDFALTVSIDDVGEAGLVKDYVLAWLPGIPPSEKNLAADYDAYRGGVYLAGDMYKYDSFDDGKLLEDQPGAAEWAGSRSKYFAYAMIPKSRMSSGAYLFGTQKEIEATEGSYKKREISAGIVMPVTGETKIEDRFQVYVGPLDKQILGDYGVNLGEFIDWGWKIIKPFSIAVYWVVVWLHKAIPNYGIVILILSIMLKVLIYPLTKKQLKSMKAMQSLQPKIEELKTKHKDNPQKMNQAMMQLYKDEKVNPFGSCLFMLPQMPLLFGLYQVFRSTIELRQAYFLPLWPDLSLPDAFPYPMPILMAVAMFFQQKLAMTDPKHKMMVYLMPIMFFFFFKGLPTGLVLYWTAFSVLSIIETLTIRKPEKLQNPQVK